jgi:hypothetical protein
VASHVSGENWTAESFGRPTILTAEQRARVVGFVREQFDIQKPVTFANLSEFIEIELGIVITADTLRHDVHRLAEFKIIEGVPFEADRLEADPEEVDEYFNCLQRILIDFPAAMIVNFDETRHCEWVDSRIEKVIVSIEFPDAKIPIPVNKINIARTITGDGCRFMPLVIIARETIETELYENSLTPDRVMFAKQENAFITRELFVQWVDEMLFPYFCFREIEFER